MQLNSVLTEMELAELVRRLDEPDLAYLFRHTLVQETARASLLKGERKRLCQLIAQTVERVGADRLDEIAPLLVQYYAEAGDDLKVVECALHAGQAAARMYANAEALDFYTQALDAARRLLALQAPGVSDSNLQSRISDLFLRRGRVLELASRHPEAIENYEEMRQLAVERGDRPMELAALMAQATIRSIPSTVHDPVRAQEQSHRALELARDLGDKHAEARILWTLMLSHSRATLHYREAMEYAEQALVIAREHNMRELLAYLLNDASSLLVFLGETERGKQYNVESRALWRELDNLPMLADNLGYAVMNHLAAAEYDEATYASEQALRISREIGNEWGEAFAQTWVGAAYVEKGEIATAIRVMEAAIALGARVFPPTLFITRGDLAQLYGDLGAVAEGISLAEEAIASGRKVFPAMVSYPLGALAHLNVLQGNYASAHALADDALDRLEQDDVRFGLGLSVAQVELLLAEGDYQAAARTAERLVEYGRARHIRQAEALALTGYGQALAALGELDRAAARVDEARALAEQTGARFSLWKVLAVLADIEQRRGNNERAALLRAQARAVIDYIAERTPEGLRDSLLARRRVQEIYHS